jgi:hypothetical protein
MCTPQCPSNYKCIVCNNTYECLRFGENETCSNDVRYVVYLTALCIVVGVLAACKWCIFCYRVLCVQIDESYDTEEITDTTQVQTVEEDVYTSMNEESVDKMNIKNTDNTNIGNRNISIDNLPSYVEVEKGAGRV